MDGWMEDCVYTTPNIMKLLRETRENHILIQIVISVSPQLWDVGCGMLFFHDAEATYLPT